MGKVKEKRERKRKRKLKPDSESNVRRRKQRETTIGERFVCNKRDGAEINEAMGSEKQRTVGKRKGVERL